jgi:protein-S-isoprenylcysteine O-methyltransferase Ste14
MAPEPTPDRTLEGAVRKWRVKNVIFLLVLAGILVGGSGKDDWIEGWVYFLVAAAGPIVTYKVLSKKSPDLLVERSRLQEGTKAWDKAIAPLIALVLPLSVLIVAALDARYAWSCIAWPFEAAGFVAVALGILLTLRAMAVNRFFAATVRIQRERGHKVVSDGPYARVRHPGYVGLIVYMLGTPLALGSRYAAIPAAACALLTVLRTALEDRTLRAELEGYAEYAGRVRSRLIPYVW